MRRALSTRTSPSLRVAQGLLAIAALQAGCVINSDKWPRPRDLTPDWSIDKTRILGIRAEPAEIRPGEGVRFEALFGHPSDAPPDQLVVWLACPVDDEGSGFGCLTALGDLDLQDPDPAALDELGVIGFEPGLPPTYVAPDDLLDDLDDRARLEGRYVVTQLLAFPNELLDDPDGASPEDIDFGAVISAYKRLVVSEALTPNHNPEIGAFLVDGLPIPAGVPVTVEPGQSYEISVVLTEDARETYAFTASDGTVEERVEEPYASWYTTGGQLYQEVSLWPYMDATWTAPETSDETGFFYIVLRDRRGGMAWHTQEFVIGRPGRSGLPSAR